MHFFTDRCTIQRAAEFQDDDGQVFLTWSDDLNLVDLPCRLIPATGGERRTTSAIWDVADHTISLAGFYPTITPKTRAVVNGYLVLDIILVMSSSSVQTQLVSKFVR